MKIAVIIEGSTKARNVDVVRAVESLNQGHEIYNLGMKNVEGEPDLSYLHTAFLSALTLNLKAVDFVLGGCGTGQGYMIAAHQFPGVFCGLLIDPVESFLFSQVNAGNCVSFQLNKNYGLGGDLNLKYMLENLFNDTYGQGYPAARKEIQCTARGRLEKLSVDAHKSMKEIIQVMDKDVVRAALNFPGVLDFIKGKSPESELKEYVLSVAAN
ncbi:MAG: RpiB/LacA/LacB family sugar-phosphate isomerase [Treponema sp.]|nr:RpiB/LacA/LacB family sugar-phosphate isomerase [Treponema sp.]